MNRKGETQTTHKKGEEVVVRRNSVCNREQRNIDIQTGEAGHGDRVKKEAFGSLQDLICEPN